MCMPYATNDPVAWCVCMSVYHGLRLAKTGKQIELLFKVKSPGGGIVNFAAVL